MSEKEDFQKNEIFDFLNEGVVFCDLEGEIFFSNWKARVYLNLKDKSSLKDIAYCQKSESFTPNQKIPIELISRGMAFEGVRICVSAKCSEKSGVTALSRPKYLQIKGTPRYKDDKLVGSALSIQDISSTIESQKSFREKDLVFGEVLDFIPGCVYSKNLEGQYRFINSSFEKIFGCRREEVKGLTDFDIFDRKTALQFRANDEKLFSSRAPVRSEEVVPHPDGNIHIYDSLKFPLFDDNNMVIGMAGISTDITETKKQARELDRQRQNNLQLSKLAALGEMAAGIAHEINNPLGIISVAAGIVRKMAKDDKHKTKTFDGVLDDIENTVQRMANIVRGLKNLSREPESSDFERTQISCFIDEALSFCKEKFKANGVQFRYSEDSNLVKKHIFCQKTQLSQVLINLLSNSYDAVCEQALPWIELKIRRKDMDLFIEIIDSGNGINAENHVKIFEPFYTTKEIGKGTGIGLSLSKTIVENHRGRLFLNTEKSNTCFVIYLPQAFRTQEDFTRPLSEKSLELQ